MEKGARTGGPWRITLKTFFFILLVFMLSPIGIYAEAPHIHTFLKEFPSGSVQVCSKTAKETFDEYSKIDKNYRYEMSGNGRHFSGDNGKLRTDILCDEFHKKVQAIIIIAGFNHDEILDALSKISELFSKVQATKK